MDFRQAGFSARQQLDEWQRSMARKEACKRTRLAAAHYFGRIVGMLLAVAGALALFVIVAGATRAHLQDGRQNPFSWICISFAWGGILLLAWWAIGFFEQLGNSLMASRANYLRLRGQVGTEVS